MEADLRNQQYDDVVAQSVAEPHRTQYEMNHRRRHEARANNSYIQHREWQGEELSSSMSEFYAPSPPLSQVSNDNSSLSPIGMTVSSSPREEEDTFFDDRSLEQRLHRALEHQLPLALATAMTPTPQSKSPSPRNRRLPRIPSRQEFLEPTLRLEQEVARLTQVTLELTDTNKRLLLENASLSREDGSQQQPLGEPCVQDLQSQLEQAQTQLKQERECILKLKEEKAALEAQFRERVRDMEGLCREQKNQLESLATEKQEQLESQQMKMQKTIESLKNELKLQHEKAVAELSDKQKEATDKERAQWTVAEKNLREQIESMERERAQWVVEQNRYKEKLEHLEKTRDQWMEEHKNDQDQCHQWREDRKNLESIIDALKSDLETAHVEILRAKERKVVETEKPVKHRLERIRDSAERVTLVKKHQENMSKLEKRHSEELSRVKKAFEVERRALRESTRMEMESNRIELTESCNAKVTEFETRIRELELEAEKRDAATTESVELASTQVTALRAQVDEKERERFALELDLARATQEHKDEHASMQATHEQELQSARNEWNEAREKLICTMQQECNQVFDRNKSRRSPQCVSGTLDYFPDKISVYAPSETGDVLSPLKAGVSSAASESNDAPSVFSDLGKSMRETEAMVQSFLKNT